VLLFLLSLLVHARSRGRMLLIGGTSGVAAAAGAIALVIGVLNVKDYFWFHKGRTLSTQERAKPGLFRRMRGLVTADNLGAMLIGAALTLAGVIALGLRRPGRGESAGV